MTGGSELGVGDARARGRVRARDGGRLWAKTGG